MYHFFCWGPCKSFYSSSLRIWLVLFWASTSFLWACLLCYCSSLSLFSISLMASSNWFTWSSSSLVWDLKVLILVSMSFFFCSAWRALLIPKAIDDSYRVWYDWMVWMLKNCYGSDLISDSDKEKASFGTVNGDLSDQFIKALWVQLFSDGANASLPGLSLLQSLIEFLL